MRVAVILMLLTATTQAQWQLQNSHTTASLRGIHAISNEIAWASGTNGAVLHTTDGGTTWLPCTTPPDADKLDFRGIQAFDQNTAIIMSTGKGDLSRLYKTTDACKSWKLVATNPDKEGFWDSFASYSNCCGSTAEEVLILGDSVNGSLRLWEWKEGWDERELELSYEARGKVPQHEASFAASNSVLQVANTSQVDKQWKYSFRWASGTARHAAISYVRAEHTPTCEPCSEERSTVEVPMASGTSTSGIFSLAFRTDLIGVAVGGDFRKTDVRTKTASSTNDGGQTWDSAQTPPHGYRSAVAYDSTSKTWITVGPNGTDISTDDGKNWRALPPAPGEAEDSVKSWNALSLPFVVGPNGRIGKLRPEALTN